MIVDRERWEVSEQEKGAISSLYIYNFFRCCLEKIPEAIGRLLPPISISLQIDFLLSRRVASRTFHDHPVGFSPARSPFTEYFFYSPQFGSSTFTKVDANS